MELFESFTFRLNYDGEEKEVKAKPYRDPVKDGMPLSYEVAIHGLPRGKIKLNGTEWESGDIIDKKLVDAIGEQLSNHYKQK
jgi:hypothetical protein